MSEQVILESDNNYQMLDNYLRDIDAKKIFLINRSSLEYLAINDYFRTLEERLGIPVIRFKNYTSNPVYESVVEGVELFRIENCDLIFAVGGGSAMDVAKCIKLFSNMDSEQNYLKQRIIPNNVRLLVLPTTAGTGSEATSYAVIYYN